MKKTSFAIAALMLVFGIACTPEDNTPKEVLATAIELSAHELTLEKGANAILTVTFTPSNTTKRDIAWVSSNTGIATVNDGVVVGVAAGETEIIAKCGEAVDRCKVTVPGPPKGAVDLGIVMTRGDGTTYSLYWAKSNLSESGLCANPEEYGDYYAWGELEPYYSSLDPLTWKEGKEDGYNLISYRWLPGEGANFKYNYSSSWGIIDNKTVLEPEDDAAHMKLGDKWRMPTIEEWAALMEQCDRIWTTLNGVGGIKMTSPNGQSIFLPAAGARGGTYLDIAGAASYKGNYWSSSLNTDLEETPCAGRSVYFNSNSMNRVFYDRWAGLPIRPVSE